MSWSNFPSRQVFFDSRKCQCQWRARWINSWQENPIHQKNKRIIQSVLQWTFFCTGLRRLLQDTAGICRWAWIEPNKQQPNRQILINRSQMSHWSAKSVRWPLSNASWLISDSIITGDDYCGHLALRLLVPEAHSTQNLLKCGLLQREEFTAQQSWLPTSVWNVRSVYPTLILKQLPRVLLMWTRLWISRRERLILSLQMGRCSSRRNSPSSRSSLKLGDRQLKFRCSRK